MNKTFKVEAGVPMPQADRRHTKYPFEHLSIGESFFVPDDFGISANAVRQAVKEANGRLTDRKFVSRRVERAGFRSGTRVWRVDLDYKLKGRGEPKFLEGNDGKDGSHRGLTLGEPSVPGDGTPGGSEPES